MLMLAALKLLSERTKPETQQWEPLKLGYQ